MSVVGCRTSKSTRDSGGAVEVSLQRRRQRPTHAATSPTAPTVVRPSSLFDIRGAESSPFPARSVFSVTRHTCSAAWLCSVGAAASAGRSRPGGRGRDGAGRPWAPPIVDAASLEQANCLGNPAARLRASATGLATGLNEDDAKPNRCLVYGGRIRWRQGRLSRQQGAFERVEDRHEPRRPCFAAFAVCACQQGRLQIALPSHRHRVSRGGPAGNGVTGLRPGSRAATPVTPAASAHSPFGDDERQRR
jgi:hypothetical protein